MPKLYFGSRGRQLDHRLMWIIDFLSVALLKEYNFSDDGGDGIVLFEKPSQFEYLAKNIQKMELDPFQLTFKASEMRDALGFSSNRLSIKEIKQLFEQLQEVIFEVRRAPVLYDAKKGTWAKTTISQNLYTLKTDEIGIISNRWKTKDCEITIRFDTIMGWLFISNLSCGTKGRITLPKEAVSTLRIPGAQNILREIRLWKKPRKYSYRDMAGLVGTKATRLRDQKRAILSALSELKEHGYINNFILIGRGKETKYKIIK